MVLYGLKTCDTCRKSLKQLKNTSFSDVRSDGLPCDVLKSAYAEFGDQLVNTRSTTWRALSDEQRAQPALELLTQHPTLMKRPLIEDRGRFYLGWGKDVQAQLIDT